MAATTDDKFSFAPWPSIAGIGNLKKGMWPELECGLVEFGMLSKSSNNPFGIAPLFIDGSRLQAMYALDHPLVQRADYPNFSTYHQMADLGVAPVRDADTQIGVNLHTQDMAAFNVLKGEKMAELAFLALLKAKLTSALPDEAKKELLLTMTPTDRVGGASRLTIQAVIKFIQTFTAQDVASTAAVENELAQTHIVGDDPTKATNGFLQALAKLNDMNGYEVNRHREMTKYAKIFTNDPIMRDAIRAYYKAVPLLSDRSAQQLAPLLKAAFETEGEIGGPQSRAAHGYGAISSP